MLRDLDLMPVYDSARCDLVRDLFVPLLSESVDYLRGVGYFSSGWLAAASHGLSRLAAAGGRARIVTSPYLSEADASAVASGHCAAEDTLLLTALREAVADLETALRSETLTALAWMVADGLLDFRIALPRPEHPSANYHDKVAVFTDAAGDRVAIHGSFNDSVQGTLNGEAFSVFPAWREALSPYADEHLDRLEQLWAGGNSQFRTCPLPEAIRQQLVVYTRSGERPYPRPRHVPGVGGSIPAGPKGPGIPRDVHLRPHQERAVTQWTAAGSCGILEMATGTGKTYTALAAAVHTYGAWGRKLGLIITVPFLHLVEQWAGVASAFGFRPVLCSSAHAGWESQVRTRARSLAISDDGALCIIAVQNTAASDAFGAATRNLDLSKTMLIADEVHYLGAPHLREAMREGVQARLGLSATPRRWMDPEGTGALSAYFGPVCFEFGLEEAIAGRFLTPYNYWPQLICLDEGEIHEYGVLTEAIAKLAARGKLDPDHDEQARLLLIRRSLLIARASAKLPQLIGLVRTHIADAREEGLPYGHALTYAAPGTHQDVLRALADLGLKCRAFIANVPARERAVVLDEFSSGPLQMLVAMKCLDEGVDIPATRTAYVLASTSNPREFVQRRGRILRTSPGKDHADVYDYIVVPTEQMTASRDPLGASLLRKEMPRYLEFCRVAHNRMRAEAAVRPILASYEMLDLLEGTQPWDAFHAMPAEDRLDLEEEG